MGELVGVVALVVLVIVVAAGTVALLTRRGPAGEAEPAPRRGATVADRHQHRWTRWKIIDERKIHLYGEVDEGRDLPDRIDVVMRRECARCGLPQTQTGRGRDPRRRD